MAEFTINGVLQASYKYDFAGRQAIRALSGGIILHSVFDAAGNRIAEYNEATGALIREYVWFNGAPLAVIEGGVTTFIRADHIGRPVFGTSTGGTKVWTASYLPFGGVRTTTGTPITARFPGQWFQSESGLHQNWMRDYDPTTGRYLQADPLGLIDGASVYGYARQSPSMYADPRGEDTAWGGDGPISVPVPVWPGESHSRQLGSSMIDAINWVNHYNPMVPVVNYCRDAVCSATGVCAASEDDNRCEELLRIDTDTCNGISRLRGKRAGAVCHASASDRWAACRAGKSIPPLNTWNN